MIARVLRVFRLYRNLRLNIRAPARLLSDPEGRVVGCLDRVEWGDGVLRVAGWSLAEEVRLQAVNGTAALARRIARHDAVEATGNPGARGFLAELAAQGTVILCCTDGGQAVEIPLHPPGRARRGLAEGRVLLRFAATSVRALPSLLRWMVDRNPANRSALARAIGLRPPTATPSVDPALFEAPPQAGPSEPFTVILPVFNAARQLRETLRRLSAHTAGDWHALVVDDASTDGAIPGILARWARENPGRVTLRRNPVNLGFVGSVNGALLAARDRPGPVVLLNSDAWVPEGWDLRLLAPLRDRRVASVSPLSNNAEILTAPLACRPVDLAPGDVDRIDASARSLGQAACAEVPTGVGFCMALSPRWLRRVPGFDPAFGPGYGEEVDWCRRVRALGARHLVQHRLFVDHAGAASFGAEVRGARVAKASAEIARRYPEFDAEVQAFLRHDPIATARMAVGIGWAAAVARGPVSIFVGHSMGGGAEAALQREVADALGDCGAAIVLRVGGPKRWRVELHAPQGVSAVATDEWEAVARLLAPIGDRKVIFSCGVGDPDPIALPGILLSLRRGGSLEMRLHDYLPVSPSYVLLDSDGCYRGVPRPDCPDPAHRARRADGQGIGLDVWRAQWARVMDAADEVRVFSPSGRSIVGRAFPGARLTLCPHRGFPLPGRVAAPRTGGRVGILGNLNRPKGGGIACRVAQGWPGNPPLPTVVFGQLDPELPVPRGMTVLGGYRIEEVAGLAERHSIGVWLMPSICPETFSFATHEMLATGRPVVGFDLGAQADALRAAENGYLIPLGGDGRPDPAALQTLLADQLTANRPARSRRAA